MGAWREVGEGMRMPCQYHTKAERDTLNAQRQDFLKAQKLQQKTAGWSSPWDHTLLGVLGTFPTKMTGSIRLNMLISKTGWSQQRLSPPCNLNAPLKVISSGTAFQLHSPWTTPSHVPKQSSRGSYFMKLSWTSITRELWVLTSGLPETGIHLLLQ